MEAINLRETLSPFEVILVLMVRTLTGPVIFLKWLDRQVPKISSPQ